MPIGNDEFFAQQGAATLRVRFIRGSNGIRAVTDLGNGMTHTRAGPPPSTKSELAAFAGQYRSEELDVEWNVGAAGDTALVLSRRRAPDQRMQPLYDNGFSAGVGTMRFTRDDAGRVTGFLLSAGRIRHVRFERTGAAR
jgi:hypothetical protein